MKNISKSLLSFICIFAVLAASVPYAFAADSGDYYVSDGILYVTGAKNLDKLNSDRGHSEVYIFDSDFSNKITVTNPDINSITFCHCNVKTGNIVLPENLREITFEETSFPDYSFLGSLSSLDSLSLSYINNIQNLKPFKNAKTITTVMVHDCKNLHTVDGIEAFQNLDYVSITDCGIESMEPLKTLKKLDTLIVTSCNVNSLEPVKNAPLTRLYLSNSVNIRNLDTVTGFKNLKVFYAENLEMAYSDKLVSFIEKNKIESNVKREALKYKSKIESIYKSIIKDGMTVQQKVEEIVWYVVDHMEYDYNVEGNVKLSAKYNRDGLKYALSGKGCCRNYASFITALMYEAGFVSYEVANGDHIWNLIKIRGHFYWLDATWLDDIERSEIIHSIYYMGDEKPFLESHKNGTPVPASYNGAKNDFFITDFENGGTDPDRDVEKNEKGSPNIEKIKKAEAAVSAKTEDNKGKINKGKINNGKITESKSEEKSTEISVESTTEKAVSVTNTMTEPEIIETDEPVTEETGGSSAWIIAAAGAAVIAAATAVIIIRKKKAGENVPSEAEKNSDE